MNEVDERMARFHWSTWAKFAAKGDDATCASSPGWPQYTHQGADYYQDLRLPTPAPSSRRGDNRLFQPADMLFWERLLPSSRPSPRSTL